MPETRVDIRDVMRGLDKMMRVPDRDARIFFTEIKPDARAHLRENQKDLTPRAASTLKRHGRLRTLGKVPGAYRWFADASGLDGKSRVPYSIALNDGGVVGNNATLPARPYAQWKPAFVQHVADRFAAFAVKNGWVR